MVTNLNVGDRDIAVEDVSLERETGECEGLQDAMLDASKTYECSFTVEFDDEANAEEFWQWLVSNRHKDMSSSNIEEVEETQLIIEDSGCNCCPGPVCSTTQTKQIFDPVNTDTVAIQCPHSTVIVETTDGERKKTSTCKIGDSDVTDDGKIDWPPSGTCDGIAPDFDPQTECPSCSADIESGWSYCAYCGEQLFSTI